MSTVIICKETVKIKSIVKPTNNIDKDTRSIDRFLAISDLKYDSE